MTPTEADYGIRQARPGDQDAIMELLREVSRWLAGKDTDQWQCPDFEGRRAMAVETDLGYGTLFVVEHLGRIVATITVDEIADADFWRHEDDVSTALYVHRMAVARTRAGFGLGSAMLDWAAGRATDRGRSALRLDAWVTNTALHDYYENLGFKQLRTRLVPDRGSGVLFERPAAYSCGLGPVLVPVDEQPPSAPDSVVPHDRHRGRLVPP